MAERMGRSTASVRVERRGALGWIVQALLLLAAVLICATAIRRMLSLLAYPYPHDGLEGTLLYEARLLRAGEALYQPLELHRFVSAPYPPLHTLALAVFDQLPGPHIFWGGRLVSVLAALGVALLATLLVRRAGAPWAVGALAGTLVLSIPPLQLWGTRIKPDLLALLWTSAGLYCASRVVWQNRGTAELRNHGTTEPRTKNQEPTFSDKQRTTHPEPQAISERKTRNTKHEADNLQPPISNLQSLRLTWSLALAAVFFACAFFTKQTAVAGPLAAGLALLASDWGDRRGGSDGYLGRLPIRLRTIMFAGLYLLLTLGIWALLDLWTGGLYTLHVWWGGERARWWSFSLFRKIVELLGFWWPQLALAVLAIPLSWRRRGLLVPVAYFLVAPLTLLGAGEQGSHHNHLLETHLALAIAGCSALGCLMQMKADAPAGETMPQPGLRSPVALWALAVFGLALAGAQIWQTTRTPAWYAGELAPDDPPERFLTYIRNTPGEILADDTGLLFQAGRELRYDDPSTMGPAAAIGAWDQSGLIEEIRQKKFSAILIPVNAEKSAIDPAGRWTPEMLAAIKEHYTLKFRDKIYTFVPK